MVDGKRTKGTEFSERVLGSLIGGAVGDALGAPIEFLRLDVIRETYGPRGISDFVPAYGRLGAITDDTQMTLFTAEGLLRAYVRAQSRGICNVPSVVLGAYRRWLETQDGKFSDRDITSLGWLLHVEGLWADRAPGLTCLSALRERSGSAQSPAENESKGSGGIMRIGPVAMMCAGLPDEAEEVFYLAKECAWLTHGHPSGYLSAASFAVILHAVLCGKTLSVGIETAQYLLQKEKGSEEVIAAINLAMTLVRQCISCEVALRQIGEGWVAEEALGVAIYCAASAKDYETGVIAAVNHDGDSDTTGLLVGQLLGAIHGFNAIPARWVDGIELRDEMLQLGRDLIEHRNWGANNEGLPICAAEKYPGV